MTKILINAKVLQQMLADQPELEIELVKNAADQVAEAFKKKVDTSVMANQMFQNLSEQLSYRHSPVSAAATDIISKQVALLIKQMMNEQAGKMIEAAVKQSIEGHKTWIMNNLNGIIVDRVNAAMRAAQEAAIKGALSR